MSLWPFSSLNAAVQRNYNLLTALTAQVEKILALLDTETATLTAMNTAIQTIDTEVKALQAQLIASGLPPSTTALDAAIATLQASVTQLTTDAAPAAPAPPAPTTPAA